MLALAASQQCRGQHNAAHRHCDQDAKAQESLQKLSDGEGLQLWVSPKGSKLWCFAYRFAGKQKKLSIGAYPSIPLVKAREARKAAKELLASGIDPGQQKKLNVLASTASQANTFELIAAELLAKKRKEGKASNTIGKREWLYSLAGDAFGKRPISEITRAGNLGSPSQCRQ
jgi:hypothetical protein